MQKRYDTVIFDLDGTLLDTLDDLAAAVNHALREGGYPERTRDEVRAFVGNGVAMLVKRAVPVWARDDEEAVAETLQAFKSYYAQHNNDATAPYPGIPALLDRLKAEGVTNAIVSNKNDPNVKALADIYFAGQVAHAVGDREGVPRKPHPDSVLHVMALCGADPARTLYVGDSDVDVVTARNAGIDCAAVLWGFRDEACLRGAGAEHVFATAEELGDFVLGA